MERGSRRVAAAVEGAPARDARHARHAGADRRRRIPAIGSPLRVALAAMIVSLLLAVVASEASAVIVQPLPGRTLSYQPLRGRVSTFDAFFSNLDYNGGPVMPSNINYTFYWRPSGAPAYPAGYQTGVNTYLEDLAHDSGGTQNVDSVSTQYNDAAGEFARYESSFAGVIEDTNPYPANGCTRAPVCLTDTQLRAELTSYITSHGLPTDLTHEYFLLTPPGVEDCFTASGFECSAGAQNAVYCAYHSNIPLGGAGHEIVYSNDPYVTGNAGCDDGNHPNGPSDGVIQGGLSHEHNESITDPEPNNAWTDIGGTGGEIGDKCGGAMGAALGKALNGASYNQLINGNAYWYQQEWSNQGHSCLQRLSFSGERPTASFTSNTGSGNTVNFDASGSAAPGGVAHYNWQFNDGPGLASPTETTAPTVSHTFAAGGSYLVALTVFAADGTSIGTAHTIIAGTPPKPQVTKLTPKSGAAIGGGGVIISGSAFSGATAVEFGSTEASKFTVNTDAAISVVIPPGTSGNVDVTVTTPAGKSTISAADVFKYKPPTVTGVTPGTGAKAGGTPVTITGSGFALGAATTFKFASGVATSVNCTSTVSCTAVSPARAKAGVVDVKATVGAFSSPKSAPADQFTYF